NDERIDEARRLPALQAVPVRIEMEARVDLGPNPLHAAQDAAEYAAEEALVDGIIEALLQLRKIALHVFGSPAVVAGEPGHLVPSRVVGTDDDHGMVRRAAAERGRARVEDPALPLASGLRRILGAGIFGIGLLAPIVVEVADGEVPARHRVLGGRAV